MKGKITVFGLTAQQVAHLEAALPDGYAVAQAQCVTDLVVADTVCSIVDTARPDGEEMRALLCYYLDVGDWLDETVVWLGEAELPQLPSFVRCASFLELLTQLEGIVAQAQCRYDGMQMYGGGYAYLPKHAIGESMEAEVYAALRCKGGDADVVRRQWQVVLEAGGAEELAAVYELTRWLKGSGYSFRVTCKTGFPLILALLDIPAEVLPNPLETGYVFHLPGCLMPQIRQWQENHWLTAPANIRFDFRQ